MRTRSTRLGRLGLAVAGLTASVLALSGPALAAGVGTIHVPSDFDQALSDTRTAGHYEVVGTSLRIYTDPAPAVAVSPDQRKVAEYVDTSTPLSVAGEPSLDYTQNSGTIPPGFQLQTDFDGDGSIDGILVGEKVYNGDWWASGGSKSFVKEGAPVKGGGSGSPWHGTLDQWRAAFPNAVVRAFGFSLGSGVTGDWTINAIHFADTRYTFAADVKLTSKEQCKNGGWATSTMPTYKNQGECVSSFASAK